MRWVGVILGLVIVGLGLFLVSFSGILINRSSNTGLMAFGVLCVLFGFGILLMTWAINRERTSN